MKRVTFLSLAAWIAFGFSCFYWIQIYLAGSILWIILGLLLLVTLLSMSLGSKSVRNMFSLPGLVFPASGVVRILSASGYFLSSMAGLIKALSLLGLRDNSFLIIPVLAIAFVFAGVAVDVFQITD